jgi:hypothetical protein
LLELVLLGMLALLVAIYAQLWIGLLRLPALGGVDFISFYTAGRIARAGAYGQLYNLDAQHAIQAPIIGPNFVPGGTLLYLRLPLLSPLLGIIATDNYVTAYILWAAILGLILALCGLIIFYFLIDCGWKRRDAVPIVLGGVLFYPIFLSFLAGQDTIVVLLGTLVWMCALLTGHDRLAGAALALTIVKPQFALALGVPLLASRRRAGWWFCIVACLLLLCSFLMVGWQGMADFVNLIGLSSEGQGYGSNHAAMYNLIGLLRRGLPSLDSGIVRGLGWAGFGISVAGLSYLWWGKGETLDLQHVGLSVVVSLFALPHLYIHDLSLLLLPALCLIMLLRRKSSSAIVIPVLLLPVVSIGLLAGNLVKGSLHFTLGYVLMIGLAVTISVIAWKNMRSKSQAIHAAE